MNGMAEAAINWEEKYLGQIDEGMSDLRSRFGKMEDKLQSMATKEDLSDLRSRFGKIEDKLQSMVTKEDLLRLEVTTKKDLLRVETKVDRFYWFLIGILGTAIGSLVVAIISLVKHP